MMKKPGLAGLLSAIVWGSGQWYNQQWLKGTLFFVFQVAIVAAELLSGNYFAGGEFVVREHAGFFVTGLWGVWTLGTEGMVLTENGLTPGDHSIILLIQGIIAIIILLIAIGIYVVNIRDAVKSAKEINETGIMLSSKEWLVQTFEHAFEYIILVPSTLMLLMFSVMPIIFAFLIAFTNYHKENLPPTKLVDWVGFDNFKFLMSVGGEAGSSNIWFYTFWNVFLWTIIFAVVATVTPFFLGLFQAVILNNKRVIGKKIWRSILILPWAIPAMISQLNFQQLFNGQFGPINAYLMDWGWIQEPIYWLSDPHNPWIPRLTILGINLWLGFPYFMALMSGIMTSISKDVYEAAEIDGANERQQFWKITLPLVLSSTAPLLVMSFSSNFNNFGLIYFLTEGGPINPNYIHAGNTDILISWIYKLTVDQRVYNMASVMSIIIFLIIGTFSAWNFSRTKAFKEEV